jgi:primary-amine oxidase
MQRFNPMEIPALVRAIIRTAIFAAAVCLGIVWLGSNPNARAQGVPRSRAPRTAPSAPAYPLDPLTANEFATLKSILSKQAFLGPRPDYVWVQLQEPPKAEVLAFKPGRPMRREAQVVALSPERHNAFEMVVDLNARKLESIKDLGNLQPFFAESEYRKAREIVDSSPEIRAALAKRGYKLTGKPSDRFYVDFYAAGQAPQASVNGKTIRAMRVLFADRQGGINHYGPYVEGLQALVDIYGGRLIAIEDTPGAVAHQWVPEDIFDRKVLGPRFSQTGLSIAPATIPDLKLAGNHVVWGNWDFRFSFNQREGLVLHQISYNDGGRLRSICYRAAVSELLVPYADPSKPWIWREFFDEGEYGLGESSSAATPGEDLPNNALTLDAMLPTESLDRSPALAQRVFFYERDGGALFAHTQGGQSPAGSARIYARAKELVAGFVATVGNYDYVLKWVFRQDASFAFEVDLDGLDLIKTVESSQCQLCLLKNRAALAKNAPGVYTAGGDQAFGTLVSPQMDAVFHQHWINLRMDFDIDGTGNAVEEMNTQPFPLDRANPMGRAFTIAETVFGTAEQARRNLNPATNRTWIIYNPSVRSALGHFAGYEIDAAENTTSCLPEARFGDDSSFVQRHFWVTRYAPSQLYAAGKYPNQAPAGYHDGLFEYSGSGGEIYNQDVVIWYSLGFTHITRPEDYPIMTADRLTVNFKPRGFFTRSPALGYATIEHDARR